MIYAKRDLLQLGYFMNYIMCTKMSLVWSFVFVLIFLRLFILARVRGGAERGREAVSPLSMEPDFTT